MSTFKKRFGRKAEVSSKLIENINISGLNNYSNSQGIKAKRFWLLVVVSSISCTFYFDARLCYIYGQKRISPHTSYHRQLALPFPFIYACVRDARNRTFIESRIPLAQIRAVIESNATPMLAKLIRQHGVGVDWIYEHFLKFIIYTGNLKPTFDVRFWYGYIELLDYLSSSERPDPLRYIDLMRQSLYTCQSVLSNCAFQGISFDCCPNNESLSAMLEDYPCFGISPNGTYAATVYQNKIGFENGLRFDTAVDTSHLFDEFVSTAGVQLHFSRELSTLTTPAFVVSNAIGYILVKLVRKRLLNNCIDKYTYAPLPIGRKYVMNAELEKYMRSFSEPHMYGPYKCELAVILATVDFGCGCLFDHGLNFRPNQSMVCTPVHEYSCIRPSLFDLAKIWKTRDGKKLDAMEFINHIWKANCLPLCDTWHYETEVGFTVLPETMVDDEDGPAVNFSDGQSVAVLPRPVLRNRYIVNFGELEYKSEVEELDLNFYQFICMLGSNLGLLLGMSAITVTQGVLLIIAVVRERFQAVVIVPRGVY